MTHMSEWFFDRYGTPEVLSLRRRAVPIPGPGEVLVKVLATAINPSDVKNVSGHFKSRTPRVPGRDFAGVVAAGCGREGEEVWGSGSGFGVARDGAHAQYIVLRSSWVGRKPAKLDMAQAAAVGVPYLTAYCSLVTEGRLQEGETALVTGVSGAVGRAATQIAHWRKARVIGAGRSPENPSGADLLVDMTKQDLPGRVMELTGGKGADLALDAVGGPMFEACLRSLGRRGRQIAIVSDPQVVSFNLVDFYHGMKHLVGVDSMGLGGEEILASMDALRAGFEAGALEAPAVKTWAFEEAVEAYRAVARGGVPVKHVLVP